MSRGMVVRTIAPLALIGIRDRRWGWTVAGIAAVSLLFLPMWPTYIGVLLDARHPAGLLYSAQDLPMLAIPLIAWRLAHKPADAEVELGGADERAVEPEHGHGRGPVLDRDGSDLVLR